MHEDRCLICGTIVPEGRQVCSGCERKKAGTSYEEQKNVLTEKERKCERCIHAVLCDAMHTAFCLEYPIGDMYREA